MFDLNSWFAPLHIIFYNLPFLLQIKPLIGPTKAIMEARVRTFQWHEFFPRGTEHMAHIHIYVLYMYVLFSHQ